MYNIERQQKILDILKERKSCSVSELAEELMFSEATIRRDLNKLDRDLKIRKTFGGAVFLEKHISEIPISIRRNENEIAKQSICKAAASLLHDNMTIFLGASSTVEYILPYLLNFSGLTVVTNSPDIPIKLKSSNICVYSTGGMFLHHTNSYVGEFARNTVSGINADLVFFSAQGISADGKITQSTYDDTLKIMIKNSSEKCLLIDSSKVNKVYPYTLAVTDEIDTIVTDKPIQKDFSHHNIVIAK